MGNINSLVQTIGLDCVFNIVNMSDIKYIYNPSVFHKVVCCPFLGM